MIVVTDTSPLHYLALIDQTAILAALFDQVHCPASVIMELRHPAAPERVRAFVAQVPPWLSIVEATGPQRHIPGLGRGESDAVEIGIQLSASLFLCDDADARRHATSRGLRVTGTLGIIVLASQRGLLDLRASMTLLSATNMRFPRDLVAAILDSAPTERP